MRSSGQQAANGTGEPIHPTGITLPEAKAMLSAALNIFDRWGISNEEARILLGSPAARTFQRWKSKEVSKVPTDTIWRLGDILGIHKSLRYMFTDPRLCYVWVKKPNSTFNGQSALDVMLAGSPSDLFKVRNYLDSEREGLIRRLA